MVLIIEWRKAFWLLGFTLVKIIQQNIVQIFKLSFFPQEARKPCSVRWLSDVFGLVHRLTTASQQIALFSFYF